MVRSGGEKKKKKEKKKKENRKGKGKEPACAVKELANGFDHHVEGAIVIAIGLIRA